MGYASQTAAMSEEQVNGAREYGAGGTLPDDVLAIFDLGGSAAARGASQALGSKSDTVESCDPTLGDEMGMKVLAHDAALSIWMKSLRAEAAPKSPGS